ncbi:MAG: biotin--[acetyl-CoA-carboxylase] ligase [Treponema sp.]|jgi:BirA family biotin operon repressor/biotin-[acetyl-CoA-carboxylase] ligase|nr:biotin--[acetyl-CoA-carboxylase] ligase [Treponema sp.]
MVNLNITSPFNAPVYYKEIVTSTMDISRELAAAGKPHGTVIVSDFQQAGRGRNGRVWQMDSGENLSFTILLRYSQIENIPKVLTLRAGLAVSFAIEYFAPSLKDKVQVKWPNDIIIYNKKAAGILCEANDSIVHAGIGINIAQKKFPFELREKATSIVLALGTDIDTQKRFVLLEKTLECLYRELENCKDWKTRIENRLYKKDEQALFLEGAAGSGKEIKGIIAGISKDGELLIIPDGETKPQAFITGEIKLLT